MDALGREVFLVRRDDLDGGFVGSVPAMPGCVSQGETVAETLKNLGEAYEAVAEVKTEKEIEATRKLVEVGWHEGQPDWENDPQLAHLRPDAPWRVCNTCGQKSWSSAFADDCKMPQPGGYVCRGSFGERQWPIRTKVSDLRMSACSPGCRADEGSGLHNSDCVVVKIDRVKVDVPLERRDCAKAGEHAAHDWVFDGARMRCSGNA